MGKAFIAGVIGGVATTLLVTLARTFGLPLNLEEMLGSMFTGELGASAHYLGLLVHLLISGLIGVLYGLGFEFITKRADWRTGVVFSLLHTVIAGLFLTALPSIHPLIPEELPAPGLMMANLGAMGVILFIKMHVIYGAIVGAICGPSPDEEPTEELEELPEDIY
jgi:hypothetical protein